jgi:hypothetical protein
LDYAGWEVDNASFVLFMLSVALMVYGFRRYRDLSVEMNARISAKSEARKLARHDSPTGLIASRQERRQSSHRPRDPRPRKRIWVDDHCRGRRERRAIGVSQGHGCTERQGYLFSKAVPATDIPALINRPANISIVA